MLKMTGWQRDAFEYPCRLAEETILPQFAHRIAGGGKVLITINSGYE